MIYFIAGLGGLFLGASFDAEAPPHRLLCLTAGIFCVAWVVTQW